MNAIIIPSFDNELIKLDMSILFSLFYPFELIGEDRPGQEGRIIKFKKRGLPDWDIITFTDGNIESNVANICSDEKYDKIKLILPRLGLDTIGVPDKVDVHIYLNFGEIVNIDMLKSNFDLDRIKSIVLSTKLKSLKAGKYKILQQPLLQFTRYFYYFGFYHNPSFTDFNIEYKGDKSFCFSYFKGFSGSDGDGNKRKWREELINKINKKFPNSKIQPKNKSKDFITCNRTMMDTVNMGWYWDFQTGHTVFVPETASLEDRENVVFTEKTFRALISGVPIILATHPSKIKLLEKFGFWTLNSHFCDYSKDYGNRAEDHLIDIFEQHEKNPKLFMDEINNNRHRLVKNQKIMEDLFYKDQDFKMEAINWILDKN